jgi:hypothetical protein
MHGPFDDLTFSAEPEAVCRGRTNDRHAAQIELKRAPTVDLDFARTLYGFF